MMSELKPSIIADLLRQTMRNGKKPFVSVISDSMAPLIRSGDDVQLETIERKELGKGDIVVINGISELITHRYWGALTEGDQAKLVTKGDRPQHFDPLREADKLIGLVIARRRDGRILRLNHGRGRWLNRQLARLAALDIRLFADPIEAPVDIPNKVNLRGGIFSGSSRENAAHRIVRRTIFTLAIIITTAVQFVENSVERD